LRSPPRRGMTLTMMALAQPRADWRFYALAALALLLAGCATPPEAPAPQAEAKATPQSPFDDKIAHYAELYEVPEALVHRSIRRESGYNPKARHGPYWGLMQIRVDTARGTGYRGPPRGLLDAETNLKYAVAYLRNAYVVAGGDPGRAIALYAGGYYYEARRKKLLDQLRKAPEE
jgi:soluble lytic murein transglycosylase-like protein